MEHNTHTSARRPIVTTLSVDIIFVQKRARALQGAVTSFSKVEVIILRRCGGGDGSDDISDIIFTCNIINN